MEKRNDEKNLEMFLKPYCNNKNIDKSIYNLIFFTQLPTLLRSSNITTFINIFIYHIIKSNKGYKLLKDKKKYSFEILSDSIERKIDKEYLKNYDKRNRKDVSRALKLASSSEFSNANFVVSSTLAGLRFLVEYQENDNFYIIDYASNLKMKKEEYEELYQSHEINRINQSTLYKLHHILKDHNEDMFNPIYFFLFSDEILSDLAKNNEFKWINKKYDYSGINKNNYYWLGDECDMLFFNVEDYQESSIYTKIRNFTENKDKNNPDFIYDKEDNSYSFYYKNKKISIQLISDFVTNEKMKNELLSEERIGKCHGGSTSLTLRMDVDNATNYLVNGKVQINEKDYFYHSWMESHYEDGIKMVFDYTCNIIMEKNDYYEMMKAVPINITDAKTLREVIELLDGFKLYLHPLEFGYFSQEIKHDLEKNKFLIKANTFE